MSDYDRVTLEQLDRAEQPGGPRLEDIATPVAPTTRPDWHAMPTPCKVDPDLWFSDGRPEKRDARDGCAVCPFREQCVDDALELQPTHGVWGGLDVAELAVERARRIAEGLLEAPKVEPWAPRCGHPIERIRVTGTKRKCLDCEAKWARERYARQRAEKAAAA